MPNQTPPSTPPTGAPPTGALPPPTTPKREPAIRTMQSDIAEALQTSKPSLISLLARQAELTTAPAQWRPRRVRTSLVAIVALVLLCLAVGAVIYYANPPTVTAPPPTPPPIPQRVMFFENEQEITVGETPGDLTRELEEAGRAAQAPGSLRRLIILTRGAEGTSPRAIELADFLELIGAAAPTGFAENAAAPPQFFIYRQSSGPSFGLIFEAKNPNRTLEQLFFWEPSLQRDLELFFLGSPPPTSLQPYRDLTYRNLDFRYLTLDPARDRGIGYLYFPAKHLIIIATSEEALHLAVDRLFENR